MVHYLNWWSNDGEAYDAFTYIIKHCSKQYEKFDDSKIYIYSLFGSIENLKKDVDGVKIYFTGENTRQRFTEYKDEDDISKYVDIICSFFKTTERSVRFPLWCLYYKFYSKGLFTLKESETSRHVGASLIARHDFYRNRIPLVQKFMNYGLPVYTTLQIPGTYGVRLGPEPIDKVNFIKNFYFNICPENTEEEGYTTEKIFQCIDAGCIPIYNTLRPVEKGILNQERIFSDVTPELIQNATIIQKMDIWDKDALVNIFLIYLRFWIQLKKCYTTKYGELELNKESIEGAIIYTVDTYNKEESEVKIKEHWRKYKQLFEPLALVQVKDENNKLYTIEDIFDDLK
jgi:hypothetical protein